MKWLILMNAAAGTIAKSGDSTVNEQLTAALAEHHIDADVRGLKPAELTAAARTAALAGGYDVIVGAGGDGTLNAVASGLLHTGVTFAALPLGTHNHFAKDMGVPLDLPAAVAALSDGEVVDLPIGTVNGNLFLNFSALGMHPRVVKHRDAQRSALQRAKWTAMMVAMTRALVEFPIFRVTLTAAGVTARRATPSVIVCNNAHQMTVFGVENASFPDRRVLNTYVARPHSRLGMLWLMAKASVGKLEPTANFEVMVQPEIEIATRHPTARVSVDGEVIDCQTPLLYAVRQGALNVLVPRGRVEAMQGVETVGADVTTSRSSS